MSFTELIIEEGGPAGQHRRIEVAVELLDRSLTDLLECQTNNKMLWNVV